MMMMMMMMMWGGGWGGQALRSITTQCFYFSSRISGGFS